MGEKRKQNDGRQIDRRSTKQVRIDSGLHREVKILAAEQERTIRELVEEGLAEVLAASN